MSERNLKQRLIELLETHHLLSANEMLAKLDSRGAAFNKTSVYRALEQLLESELICRHHLQKDQAAYELRQHHHSHLVCTSCGQVTVTDCQLTQPPEINGFKTNHHHTTFFGVCRQCSSGH